MKVKAKDKECWQIWHYGTLESPSILQEAENSVTIVPRTVCEDTGLMCKGRQVYENDWLEVYGDGEKHKFLVAWRGNEYRACEDEAISYNLKNVLKNESCKVIGNLYD